MTKPIQVLFGIFLLSGYVCNASPSLSQIKDDPSPYLNQEVEIQGQIRKSCSKKVCHFLLESSGKTLPIKFRVTKLDLSKVLLNTLVLANGIVREEALSQDEVKAYLAASGNDFKKSGLPKRSVSLVISGLKRIN